MCEGERTVWSSTIARYRQRFIPTTVINNLNRETSVPRGGLR